VLVAVDTAGFLVLLFVQGAPIRLSETTIVLGAHAALFLVDTSLLMLEVRGFTGSELAALDALRDAGLLVGLALVDVVIVLARGRGRRRCLCKDGDRGKNESGDEGKVWRGS
jgi:hypothetical protein